MAKKIIAWLLVIATTATIAVGGTLAYLTDRDSEANVFTVGDVDITLNDEFQQESQLKPGVDIEKNVSIKNEGPNEAYVWYTYAVPQGLEKGLLLAFEENTKWSAGELIGTKEVDGVTYNVYASKYSEAISAGVTTDVGLTKVTMDSAVDITPEGEAYLVKAGVTEKLNWNINNTENPVIFVNAYAIQTQDFTDVDAAYEAFKGQWGDMVEAGTYEITGPAPVNPAASYNGETYDNIYEAVAAANAAGGGTVTLLGSAALDRPVEINSNITIAGDKAAYTRAEGYTGTMFAVKSGNTLTTENLTLDGAGAAATGNLIATEGSGSIVLNEGTVLQNNNGAHAVSLATRGGGSLTLNGAQIVNNSSDSGAIWGGGHIIVNDGSKINNNASTGSAGAIRMVSGQNLTMNGGEISNNTAAATGGAIYGYGSSTYNFNGGKMNGNTAATGGAMYTGDSSVINISGTFEMSGNTADEAGALRLSNRTQFNMSGGKLSGNVSKNNGDYDGFYGWNPGVNISGGELADDVTIQGGLTPTVGGSGITGVVHFAVSTNHNTVNLAKDFGTIKFTVAEGTNFSAFNFKPAADYTYTAGDEAKLVCQNAGYTTYWDAATGLFKLKTV